MRAGDIEKFIRDGWVVVDVPQPDIMHECASVLEKMAREITGTDCRLDAVHRHVNDKKFKQLHQALSEYFWQSEFSLRAGKSLLGILKEFIGLDILVQYMPYLRLARPGESQDNIGYHRDTQYGQTPYELAVHVPFVDLDEQAALKIISGSHRLPENAFSVINGVESGVVKGSMDHRLGKPYAPKPLALPKGIITESLSMRVGQAALFSPALFHGQEINLGDVTRVSADVRFVNPNANVPLKMGKTHAGYVPIAHSPVQQLAREYYEAQQA